MPRYAYQVRDRTGRTESGVLAAEDLLDATRGFRRDGKIVVSMREETAAVSNARRPARRGKVKKDEIIYFATQLAVMVDTGVPLSEALDAIADAAEEPAFQAVVSDLAEQVKGGIEFSKALERHPKQFSPLFVALMRASEASGTMGQMLQRLSEYLENERATRKRIKGALTYPAAMVCFCVTVVIAMLVFIMPRFEKIYSSKGAVLPAPTRILLAVSRSLADYWAFYLLGICGAVTAGWMYLRTPAGRRFMDKLRIELPVIGQMYRITYLARSLRTMAAMVSAGVSMLEGLDITAQVAENYYYRKIWLGLADGVKEGCTLSEQLSKFSLVPATVSQMIAAGERTGRLAKVMNRVAGFCEEELRVSARTVTGMIEPLMVVVMGAVIGAVALALLLPVFSIAKVVAR